MIPRSKIVCAACEKQITDKKQIICTARKCGKQYHLLCVNLESPNSDAVSSWICPNCQCSMKKGGDNSSTPARASQNVTVRKPRADGTENDSSTDSSRGESPSPLAKLTAEINLLRQDISSMRSEFDVAIKAVRLCENRLETVCAAISSLESRLLSVENKTEEISEIKNMSVSTQEQLLRQTQDLAAYESRLKTMEEQVALISELKACNDLLREQLDSHSQAMLRNDIEILGVTESSSENSGHLFLTLAAVAGLKPADSDIEFVTRVGQPRTKTDDQPRPLVVRFSRRSIRDQFLKLAKTKRLTTKHISLEGPPSKIYFNDRLTRERRSLFRECRVQFKEKAGYKFCWTSGGQIYVKKREGKGNGTAAINVRSNSDIFRILSESEKDQNE